MTHPNLLNITNSVLLVIDMQERLLPNIHNKEQITLNCNRLINGAAELGIPIIISEQYPRGLGPTISEIKESIDNAKNKTSVQCIEKTTFSCTNNDDFLDVVEELNRDQVIICGIEAHICVLQTALGLTDQGLIPYVVADAIGSRVEENKSLSIGRLEKNGSNIIVTESALLEMLEDSRHPSFKAISKLIK
jgi:nicotinamidase-related amidase